MQKKDKEADDMPLGEMTVLEVLELYALGFEINLNDGMISCIKERME